MPPPAPATKVVLRSGYGSRQQHVIIGKQERIDQEECCLQVLPPQVYQRRQQQGERDPPNGRHDLPADRRSRDLAQSVLIVA